MLLGLTKAASRALSPVRDRNYTWAELMRRVFLVDVLPCIVRTRIPVWLLEQARRLGAAEADLLRSYPSLRAEDLVNAWAFVRAHREEIERQIAENEAA